MEISNGRERMGKEGKTVHKDRPGKGAVPKKVYRAKSGSPPKGFGRAVGVTRIGQDGGTGNSQGGDMGQRV